MNNKSLRVLEFFKIRNLLKDEITSNLGKELADGLLPSANYDEVLRMQNETSEAASLVMQTANMPTGPLYDLTHMTKVAEIGASLTPRQLLDLSDTFRTTRTIRGFIMRSDEDRNKFPILLGLAEVIVPFKDIEDSINIAIIGENQISDNASFDLKRIRKGIENKNTSIRSKLDSIIRSSTNQKYLQDSLITIRQDRFVVPVKSEYKSMIKGLVHDQSSSGQTLYIEPFAIVELNNELKELKIEEHIEIERILLELSGMVGQRADQVRANQDAMKNIDFILGKGKLSIKMRAIQPKLNNNRIVNIRNARHPLIDPKDVVANTIYIGDKFKTLLITGPNTGGKTVMIKTLGLLAIMNQSGLHIPADFGSEMTIFSQIFADIGDEQSIEQSLSTFSSHMTNIVEIIDTVDVDSLVLFDELGAGTDPTEGAALAMSILMNLYRNQITTVATTHYSELKEFALLTEGIENASVEFDIETLSPTYKLLIGVPGKSNAFEISRKLGLWNSIIDEAKVFITSENIEFEDVLSSIEANRKTSEAERDEAIRLRLEIEKLKKKVLEKEDRINVQRDRLLKDAKEESRKMLKEAKDESEKIIKELRGIKKDDIKTQNKKIEEMRRSLKDKMDKSKDSIVDKTVDLEQIPKNLKIGDSVKVVKIDQTGTVSTLPDSSGNLMVQVGIMKVNANIKGLMLVKVKKEHRESLKISKNFGNKAMNTNPEFDVRGLNVEEAMVEIDKYLDDAYLANLNNVTIIHGVGTGALKAGLKGYFRKNSHVKKFRDGVYGEGGHGVTIIELK
ncbi:MAG: endonuclease MutS2 [Acidaminobacteraceae bacterium]